MSNMIPNADGINRSPLVTDSSDLSQTTAPRKRRKLVRKALYTIVAAAGLVILVSVVLNPRPVVEMAVTPHALSNMVLTPPPAVPAALGDTTFTDGEYVVGQDMPAGVYKTDGQSFSGSCYWAHHKNDGGAAGDLIGGSQANHVGSGPTSFKARQGEVMELSLGCTYNKVG